MSLCVDQKTRKQIREQLVKEGVNGQTVMDILPNTAYPLQGESEAMYFKYAREFLKTSVAHKIMERNQDIIRRP